MTVRRLMALFAMVLLLGGCSAGDAGTSAESAADSDAVESAAGGEQAAAEDDAGDVETVSGAVEAGGGAGEGGGAGVGAADDADADADIPEVDQLPDPPAVRPGDRIIKDGTISIEVGQDQFDKAFSAVIAAARRYGGDVVGSSTRTAENGDTFGSVTVRVPVENFEDLVIGVGDIGEIRNRDVNSKDVSAEYTDLESRLRHLQAQERFYLALFDRADSVDDAIQVQQQLDGIQNQIEKIQGRINLLDDRTTFSTLTVELFEPEAGGELLQEEEPTTDRPSLAHYWQTARDAFVNVVGALLVAVMFLLPLLLPLVVAVALWLAFRRPRRQDLPPPAAEDADEREPVGAGR